MSQGSEPTGADTRAAHVLSTAHLSKDIKGRAVRGAGVSLSSAGVAFFIQMGATAALARLLSPHDFGLVGMVRVFTGLVGMFTDAGLSMATVQQEKVNHDEISTLFWLNGALGIFLMVITGLASPVIAWMYREPELLWITLGVAVTFPLAGFSVQHTALLKRRMRFKALALRRMLSLTFSSAVAVGLAFAGFGYWALVAQGVAGALITMLSLWWLCRWMPGKPKKLSDVRPMLEFGGFLSASQFLGYLRRNMDRALIGLIWGAESVGIYRVAHRMILLPIQQINSPIGAVMVPALSRVQDDDVMYRSIYRDAVFVVVSITLPTVGLMLVTAHDLVRVVLGEKWMASVPIFFALGPAALAGALNVAAGWVFVSSGQAKRQFKANVWLTVFIGGAMLVGLYWGAMGVAAAFSFSFCVSRVPHFNYAFVGTPITLRIVGEASLWPTIACVAAAAVALAVQPLLAEQIPPVRLVAASLVFGLVYMAFNGLRLWRVVQESLRGRAVPRG